MENCCYNSRNTSKKENNNTEKHSESEFCPFIVFNLELEKKSTGKIFSIPIGKKCAINILKHTNATTVALIILPNRRFKVSKLGSIEGTNDLLAISKLELENKHTNAFWS